MGNRSLDRALNKGLKRYRRKPEKSKAEVYLTYTKMLVSVLTALAALWITWSYVLATAALILYENVDPLSTVSEEVCRTVIAVVIGYCTKSLFENISKYTVHDQLNNESLVNEEQEAAYGANNESMWVNGENSTGFYSDRAEG